ncbi:DUF1289 domain-containing protein [Marinobacter sp.]|uniref:DUF1289 domain-containing protein n=1 Tax=Marinobacter sp. TaxID=50741 RepID=UPI00345C024D
MDATALNAEDLTASPCRRECKVEDSHCRACHRSLDAIAQWSRMTDSQRIEANLYAKARASRLRRPAITS